MEDTLDTLDLELPPLFAREDQGHPVGEDEDTPIAFPLSNGAVRGSIYLLLFVLSLIVVSIFLPPNSEPHTPRSSGPRVLDDDRLALYNLRFPGLADEIERLSLTEEGGTKTKITFIEKSGQQVSVTGNHIEIITDMTNQELADLAQRMRESHARVKVGTLTQPVQGNVVIVIGSGDELGTMKISGPSGGESQAIEIARTNGTTRSIRVYHHRDSWLSHSTNQGPRGPPNKIYVLREIRSLQIGGPENHASQRIRISETSTRHTERPHRPNVRRPQAPGGRTRQTMGLRGNVRGR